MSEFRLKIINTEGVFFDDMIEEINLKDMDGKFSILCNHENKSVFIFPSRSYIKRNSNREVLFISFGIANISKGGETLITCEACEWKKDIDIERAKESKNRAMKRLEQKSQVDTRRAENALMRSIARIDSAK